MDKRSWPWKKKSYEKHPVDKSAATSLDASASQVDQGTEDSNKKPKYVQISLESYTHLSGLEEQIKSYEEQVNTLDDEVTELNEKLSEAHSEITNKDVLVKQHSKVAEEAVSGWEKAEAEAAALKNSLESVTLMKLTAEDRASHLDGALKECMRQMRNLKEEHDQKLHEVFLTNTKKFDKVKLEMQAKISNLDQEILRSVAENAALSRSLQEHSHILVKINEEKSQAEVEIQLLTSKIESCEKEVNSLKYELHIARKEVEIRNEEKNMSVRSAEVANKQHLEGVKKIAKLEAECQRLRGLVRKRLPGPAALAQMKIEVENLGRDYGEPRLRRSPARPSSPHLSQLPDFAVDSTQKYQKDNEVLTERFLAMDEETKMLKEALAKRNSELQASRILFAQTATKLQSLEAQLHANGEQRSSPGSNALSPIVGFYNQNIGIPSSHNSFSEEGNDDSVSCVGSSTTIGMPEFSHLDKKKNAETGNKENHLDLMDDFLEMEKLAYQSNGSISRPDVSGNTDKGKSDVKSETSLDCTKKTTLPGEDHGSDAWVSSNKDATARCPQIQADLLIFMKLQSKVSMILDLISAEGDMENVVEDIRQAMLDMKDSFHHQLSVNSVVPTDQSVTANDIHRLAEDAKTVNTETISEALETAISQIDNFLVILGKEAKAISLSTDEDGLNKKISIFSDKYCESMKNGIDLNDYVVDISNLLNKASDLHFNILGFRSSEVEIGSSDCIDKIALPENKDVNLSGDRYPNGCALFSDSASDPDVPRDGNLVPTSESTSSSCKCSLEEFEQLKLDRDNLTINLARCSENFEMSKAQLLETEQLLVEVKSQLASAQKSNSLAETQLKCMTESYKSLETRAEELQSKVNLLQGKIERLDNDLQEERKSHQDALTRCRDLQEQLQSVRIDSCEAADGNDKINQEMEMAAAAKKLAECQETIFLLGKKLNAMRPQAEVSSPPNKGRIRNGEYSFEEEPTLSGMNLQDADSSEMDATTGFNLHGAGSESSLDTLNAPVSPDTQANISMKSPISKYSKHHPSNSGSSSGSSTPTPEKQARVFSRFFSSK